MMILSMITIGFFVACSIVLGGYIGLDSGFIVYPVVAIIFCVLKHEQKMIFMTNYVIVIVVLVLWAAYSVFRIVDWLRFFITGFEYLPVYWILYTLALASLVLNGAAFFFYTKSYKASAPTNASAPLMTAV